MDTRRLQFIIDAENRASAVLGQVGASLDKLNSRIAPAAEASTKVAVALGGATLALGAFGVKALQASADMEQAQVAFGTMLGSAEKAQTFLAEMKDFAKRTPFETADIAKAAQTMLAFGIDAEKVMPTVQMIGDVAMGNKEKFSSLSLAFAQVQSTGRLMGQDLLQMVNQGFNPLQIISQKTGESMAALKDRMAAGAISADEVTEAFKIATSEGGRFFGGMEAQSKTLTGLWSTMQDGITVLMQKIGDRLLPVVKELVAQLTSFIENTLPQWIEKMIETAKWLDEHRGALIILASVITSMLIPTLLHLAGTFIIAFAPLIPWMIGGAMIGAIIAGIYWLVQNWDMLKAKAMEIFNAIAAYLAGIWASITGTAQAAWNSVAGFFVAIWETIKVSFETALNFIGFLVAGIFSAMGIDIFAVWTGISDFFSTVWTKITEIFNTATNGISTVSSNTWNSISRTVSSIWNAIESRVSAGWNWIVTKFNEATKPLTMAWTSMWDAMGNGVTIAWDGIKSTIKAGINWVIEKINSFINSVNAVAQRGADMVASTAPQIPTIPLLAKGGIVTRPTLAMIGEAGPEAVLPLRNSSLAGAGGFGNITISITGNEFLGEEGVAERIGNDIMRAIKSTIKL